MKQIIRTHRFQFIASLLFCLCVAALPALAQGRGQGRGGFNSQGMREHHELGFPGTIADAVASFTRYYDLFDKERKGRVPLATLLEAMSGGEAGEVRTLNRYKGWDKDKDGLVSRAEMTTGIEASVNAMVERQMKADADGDGALAPAEYLLSIPATGNPNNPAINPANEEKNANGLTSRQQRMFDGSEHVVQRGQAAETAASRADLSAGNRLAQTRSDRAQPLCRMPSDRGRAKQKP